MFPPHSEWLCWEAIYTKLLCERKLYVFRMAICVYKKGNCICHRLVCHKCVCQAILVGGYNCQWSLKESSKITLASMWAGNLFNSSRGKELYLQQRADESWYFFCEPSCPSPVITDTHPTLSIPKLSKLGTLLNILKWAVILCHPADNEFPLTIPAWKRDKIEILVSQNCRG